jgi:hypothetical protein
MPSPMTESVQVPYSENEQQFLVLAVQAAVRTFRSMHANPGDHTLLLSSPGESDPSTSATQHAQ